MHHSLIYLSKQMHIRGEWSPGSHSCSAVQ